MKAQQIYEGTMNQNMERESKDGILFKKGQLVFIAILDNSKGEGNKFFVEIKGPNSIQGFDSKAEAEKWLHNFYRPTTVKLCMKYLFLGLLAVAILLIRDTDYENYYLLHLLGYALLGIWSGWLWDKIK